MIKPDIVMIDGDIIAFKAAAAVEKRFVIVTHTPSGAKSKFDNRTDFYGHHAKKAGGWLAERNAERIAAGKRPYSPDEFTFEDDRIVEPLENALHSARQMIIGIVKKAGCEDFLICMEGTGNYRHEVATMCKYKDRADQIRPLYLKEVKAYLRKNPKSITRDGMEGDDLLAIYANKGWAIQATIDKDAFMVPGWIYDFEKAERPFLIKDGVGKVWIDKEGKIRAMGFKALCHQMLCGDNVDTIKPRALCGARYGEKTSFKELEQLRTQKECMELVLRTYKKWYPEPVTYKHWKTGEELTKDYFQIASEIFTLLWMLRDFGDTTTLGSLCEEIGVEHIK